MTRATAVFLLNGALQSLDLCPVAAPAEVPVYLVEISAHTGSGVETLRFAETGVVVDGNYYEPRLKNPGSIRAMLFGEGTTSGPSVTGYGEVILINSDGGLDALLDYGIAGRTIMIKKLLAGAVTLLMACSAEQPTVTMDEVSIRIKDPGAVFDTPVQTAKYAGTNNLPAGVEGTDDIKGKEKPLVFGAVYNITPVLVNTSRLIYQANDGSLSSLPAVYDKGVKLAAGTAYSSQADMEGNAPAAGEYRAWLAGGMFRLGSAPAGQITCDAVEGATAADRSAAQVAKRIALRKVAAGDLVTQDFSDLDALNSAEIGIYLGGGSTIRAALDEVLGSIGGWWAFDAAGKLNVGRLDAPAGTPVLDLTPAEVISIDRQATNDQGRGVPAYRVNFDYQKNYTVQDAGSLAGRLADKWDITANAQALLCVTYGNGVFVGIGFTGPATSTDGTNWTTYVSGTLPKSLGSITYGNGLFVTGRGNLDASSTIYNYFTSPDGIAWTKRTMPLPYYDLNERIKFANGYFWVGCSGANATKLLRSSDGINWTTLTLPRLCYPTNIAYGGGKYVLVNSAGDVLTSIDGTTWTYQKNLTAPAYVSDYWNDLVYFNGLFVAGKFLFTNDNAFATSPDGVNWTLRPMPSLGAFRNIVVGTKCIIALSYQDSISLISEDGISWKQVGVEDGRGKWHWGGYGNGTFVAIDATDGDNVVRGLYRDTAEGIRVAFVSNEFRAASTIDNSILTPHPNAAALDFQSLIISPTAAQSEANRLLSLHKVRRDFILVTCKRSALPAQLPAQGKVVQLTYPRFGYDAGKLFVFMGFEQHLDTDDVTLYLWG